MTDSVKDLWKKEDTEFLKDLATDVAREAYQAKTAENPEVHRQNLLHLAATLRGEITRKRLQIRMWSRENFVKILETIIKTVASIILELIKKK